MCTGTIYWTNIGRIVYAASEEKLADLTGGDNAENMTMSMPCRRVVEAGQKDIEVVGPVRGWEDKVLEESAKWWRRHQQSEKDALQQQQEQMQRQGSTNGSVRSNGVGAIPIKVEDESILSSIGEDGEYKADLQIDWMT